MKKYIKIMRIDHWIKQLFILPGFVCALYLGGFSITTSVILNVVIGLLATSLVASANYVINEYLDAEFDKYHPIKKSRVLVDKDVKGYIIWLLWFVLGLLGLLLGYFKLGFYFFLMEVLLLVMGILYHVVKTKK